MDELDRALRRLKLENEPAQRHRRDLEIKATFLLGELRNHQRQLQESEFSDMSLLDEEPPVVLLDLQNWTKEKMTELLRILPHLRQQLIDLDQADAFRDKLALEMAMRKMSWANGYAEEWEYDRAFYSDEDDRDS